MHCSPGGDEPRGRVYNPAPDRLWLRRTSRSLHHERFHPVTDQTADDPNRRELVAASYSLPRTNSYCLFLVALGLRLLTSLNRHAAVAQAERHGPQAEQTRKPERVPKAA